MNTFIKVHLTMADLFSFAMVVRLIIQQLGFTEILDPEIEEWHLLWTDTAPSLSTVLSLEPFQVQMTITYSRSHFHCIFLRIFILDCYYIVIIIIIEM